MRQKDNQARAERRNFFQEGSQISWRAIAEMREGPTCVAQDFRISVLKELEVCHEIEG
jgi:hypothetical protein